MTTNNNKTVAVIPARGGSKGIPKKNLQLVGGVPLIQRIVKEAVASDVDEVWVSTDDKDIFNASMDAGATGGVERPVELCGDYSNSEDALLHFAEHVDFDVLVFLQCTSPLTTAEDIDKAVLIYASEKYDSLLSVCEDHGGWLCGGFTWKLDENASQKSAVRETPYSHQRQSMGKRYRENGAIYVTSKKRLLESGSRISGDVGLYIMPKSRSFEIDEPEDLILINRYLACETVDHELPARKISG